MFCLFLSKMEKYLKVLVDVIIVDNQLINNLNVKKKNAPFYFILIAYINNELNFNYKKKIRIIRVSGKVNLV